VRETFTVRKQSFGVGVERTFPLHSPKIEKIEVASRGEVRRAKLYYLRDRVGKRARVRERRSIGPEEVIERELLHAPGADEPAATEVPDAEALAPDTATAAPETEAPVAETAEAPAAEADAPAEAKAEAPPAEAPDTAEAPDSADE